MRRNPVGALLKIAVCAMASADLLVAQTPEVRVYQVNYTSVAPLIDARTSVGEWDLAANNGDQWGLLRVHPFTLDRHGNSFDMLWDEKNLYVKIENSYGGHLDPDPAIPVGRIDFSSDNLNLFFDPNLDNEENFDAATQGQLTPQNQTPDGYQIALNTHPGQWDCGGDRLSGSDDDCSIEGDTISLAHGSSFGTFAEAHFDALWGNQGSWGGMRTTEISSFADTNGSVVEMRIPWQEFDAVGPDKGNGTPDHSMDLGGNSPANGDVWFFNVAQITTDLLDNFLPIWNWHSRETADANFSERPHGEIVFQGQVINRRDVNRSGVVSPFDALIVINYLSSPDGVEADLEPFSEFVDVNLDGITTPLDALLVINDLNQPAASSSSLAIVPEPATHNLLVAAIAILAVSSLVTRVRVHCILQGSNLG